MVSVNEGEQKVKVVFFLFNIFVYFTNMYYLCSEIATRSRISNCSLKLMNLLFCQE